MTKEEFESFVKEQKESGKSEEEIVIGFCSAFKDNVLDRKQFEACLDAVGYGLSDEFKAMSDEELKKNVLEEKEPEEGEGKPAPEADKEEVEEKSEEKEEEKSETKEDGSEEKEEDEEERKKAFGLFGLED